jgi:GNAT superfamily N-acetyltransferase
MARDDVSVIHPLDDRGLEEVAVLVAEDHRAARSLQPLLPATFDDPQACHETFLDLLAAGYRGFVAVEDGRCRGVMCGKAFDDVGFMPAHGLAVDRGHHDPTAVVGHLFAELAPALLDDGASRFTIDHVQASTSGAALSDLGFGRSSVFASQHPRPIATSADVDVRIATSDDLESIAALSQIEIAHRSTPPIYAPGPPPSLAETRTHHQGLLDSGAVHFLARRGGDDVGLLTVELTSPAPRLCPAGQPYIGPTATHPDARGTGIGTSLVIVVLDWAGSAGHETVSVDFDSANPLSRPFWLGLGFQPTGSRLRRAIDARYHRRPAEG